MQAVYVQTNDAEANALVAYAREDDGTLKPVGRFETGGRGSGTPHLPSQGSVVVAGDRLIVANAGSDDVSLFALADPPRLVSRTPSGGSAPRSIAVHGDLVYVLNTGEPAVAGFRRAGDALEPLGVTRPAGTDPAQVAFSPDGRTLVVTDRADTILLYAVEDDGTIGEPERHPSAGATPYGFAFTSAGTLIVTEAAGARIGEASASSYRVDGTRLERISEVVGDTRSEVCWAVVHDDRHAFVTNFGDGTISSYEIGADGRIELANAAAATTVEGAKGVRDEALSSDGRFLYALDADARRVFAFRVDGGSLEAVGSADGLPATAAGLAAV
jgi:6-phosphogluconolactonase (cycloisomerase 2 family)